MLDLVDCAGAALRKAGCRLVGVGFMVTSNFARSTSCVAATGMGVVSPRVHTGAAFAHHYPPLAVETLRALKRSRLGDSGERTSTTWVSAGTPRPRRCVLGCEHTYVNGSMGQCRGCQSVDMIAVAPADWRNSPAKHRSCSPEMPSGPEIGWICDRTWHWEADRTHVSTVSHGGCLNPSSAPPSLASVSPSDDCPSCDPTRASHCRTTEGSQAEVSADVSRPPPPDVA